MHKKLIVMGILVGLMAGALAAPATAKKKKPKKPPAAPVAQPVPTTMYLEGTAATGEQDAGQPVVSGVPGVPDASYLKLTKEVGSGEKSMGIASYSAGPNNSCGGNSLFPVFVGDLAGQVTGDVKVTFEAVGTPSSKVEVRVWPDLPATPAAPICNEAYVEPAGKVVVDLPSSRGPVEAVIPGVDFTSTGTVMVQLTAIAGAPTAPSVPPFYGRVYYGLENTKVEFSCLPAAGAASCLP